MQKDKRLHMRKLKLLSIAVAMLFAVVGALTLLSNPKKASARCTNEDNIPANCLSANGAHYCLYIDNINFGLLVLKPNLGTYLSILTFENLSAWLGVSSDFFELTLNRVIQTDPEFPEEEETLKVFNLRKTTSAYVIEILGGTSGACVEIFLTATYATFPLPPEPVKVGHDFAGWYLDEELTQPYEGTEIVGDITLYAKFTPQIYTVKFQTNAPSLTAPDVTAAYDSTVTPPVLTRVGYTFDGWFTDAALTQAYKADAPVVGDMTLYAKWTIKMYTVTFVVDGETYHTVTVPYGTTLTEALKQAGLPYYAIGSIVTESGDAGDGETVTETMTVTLSEASVPNKILTFLRLNWIYLTCGAGGLILLIGVGVAIAKKKKA